MTWFKVDDGFWSHPKVMAIGDTHGPEAQALAVTAWLLVATNRAAAENGPTITRSTLNQSLPCWTRKMQDRAAALLVEAGFWETAGECWTIRDWYDYQPTEEELAERRARGAERKRRFVERHRNAAGNTTGNAVTDDVTEPVTDAVRNAESDAFGSGSGSLISDLGSQTRARPISASTPMSRMMESLHQEAIKQARAKGHGDPPETRNPFWDGWKTIARWVLDAAKLRGWDEEQGISMGRLLVVAFYESEDPRTKKGYPLSYLAKNPAQYAEEAKGRAA